MAGRICTVCTHAERAAIDMLLVNRTAASGIAAKYRVSQDALDRHRGRHLPKLLAQSHQAEQTAQADDLVTQVKALRGKSVSILMAAERAGDLRTALVGIRTALACLTLLAEVERAIDRRPTLNLTLDPQWLRMRTALVEAIRPYPEAAVAVAEVLIRLEQPA